MVKKLTYFVLKGDLSFVKKLMCMLLVTTLLVFSVLPVYAYDDKTSLNGYELSIQRFVGKISSKNEIEVAEDILKSIDLSEEYISKMPEKEKLKIYNAEEIYHFSQYCKIDESGKETILSKEEYESSLQSASNNMSDDTIYENSEKESNLQKDILCYRDDRSEKGVYTILVSFSWIKMPIFRGKNVVSISSNRLEMVAKDFGATYGYTKTTVANGHTTVKDEIFNDDITSLKDTGRFKRFINGVAYIFNLPINTPYTGANYNSSYSGFYIFASIRAKIATPNEAIRFNVYGAYHHQTLSVNPSISITSGEISVSPKLAYGSAKRISFDDAIDYIP